MTTLEVANRLVELCRAGQYEDAQNELFAEHATATEPANSPMAGVVTGVAAIIEKGKQFDAQIEEHHHTEVSQPIVAGNTFAITLSLDATFKGQGRRTMDEVIVYQVNDGKIVSEQFFY